jgi:hypothetical protein
MAWFSLVFFVAYMMLLMRIIPKSGFDFDLFEIKFRLLPYWTKLVSVLLVLIALRIYLFNFEVEKSEEYLISSINMALFLFLFSKQKNENEYTQQVRFKSFTYSFVSFVALIGAFSAIGINASYSTFIADNFMLSVLVGSSLFMSLLYFYITLYKGKKEGN